QVLNVRRGFIGSRFRHWGLRSLSISVCSLGLEPLQESRVRCYVYSLKKCLSGSMGSFSHLLIPSLIKKQFLECPGPGFNFLRWDNWRRRPGVAAEMLLIALYGLTGQ